MKQVLYPKPVAFLVGCAHLGQAVAIRCKLLDLSPVVPQLGEMQVGIVDVAIGQAHMEGGPGLDAWIANAGPQLVRAQVQEQGHQVQGPVAGGVVTQVIGHELFQVGPIVWCHDQIQVLVGVRVDIGGELAADIQLAAALEPGIEPAEGAQVVEDGGSVQSRQLRIQLQAKGVPEGVAAAEGAGLSQLDAQSLNNGQLGKGNGRANHFQRYNLLRCRINEFPGFLRQKGQGLGQVASLQLQMLDGIGIQFNAKVA